MYKSQNLPSASLRADSIGYLVFKACFEGGTARVIGTTSRGIFLLTPTQRVIFISHQIYRSPLTLTLAGLIANLDQVQPGMEALISPESIEIPASQIKISFSDDLLWTTLAASGKAGTYKEIHSHLADTIDQVLRSGNGLGFSPLLLPIIGPDQQILPDPGLENILVNIHVLASKASSADPDEILALLHPLIGFGRGLTPSGDDFIMGWLLTYNRWPQLASASLLTRLSHISQMILKEASQATTSISVNLIECATYGQGDERPINALDGIIDGSLPPRDCAANLIALGASSGIDALAGITSAIYAAGGSHNANL